MAPHLKECDLPPMPRPSTQAVSADHISETAPEEWRPGIERAPRYGYRPPAGVQVLTPRSRP